ncbi:HlyD family type I secretion periplasmic adaptor subunit [Pontixanthobacter gangjinensis]|uniref:Membrane fusion protein (MFP) family protein n=1 Tax=Pontixanthobacter gangjinensis TaxID=1028742 RepID=A0A6I4SQ40_9SPHN|nr:HlyD family type I secretion periplasmic adaptor subunit [Pontixanthobacter gangjinensis]MXO57925.1 HlyD family type I secretion periplasmic adaptor subunit [Pontixanthobacter gangjinensis]
MSFRNRLASWDANTKLIAVASIGLSLLLLWASFAQVDEITRGIGKVIPSSKTQVVQPSEPAVVSAILVRGGQQVEQGQLLVRLDDAQASSELGQLETENERLSVRANRLDSEASGRSVGCAPGTQCSEERRLSQMRRATAQSREAALSSAIEQRRRDMAEGQASVATLENSVRLSSEQVAMLQPLAEKGIVPQTELLTAQRELVETRGRLSAARQGVARARAAVAEAQSELNAARLDFRQQALNERSEINTRIAVNQETIRGAEAKKDRNELRAPVDGIVNDVQISTIGGFVNAGQKLMQVVPIGDKLLVEARVSPSDIAFIKVGDTANVKVTAYDFSIFGGLPGKVQQISADSIFDEVEREAYYLVLIETDLAYIERAGQRLPIVPGMVCDVEIVTGRKSILTYLLKPVAKAFGEALTER